MLFKSELNSSNRTAFPCRQVTTWVCPGFEGLQYPWVSVVHPKLPHVGRTADWKTRPHRWTSNETERSLLIWWFLQWKCSIIAYRGELQVLFRTSSVSCAVSGHSPKTWRSAGHLSVFSPAVPTRPLTWNHHQEQQLSGRTRLAGTPGLPGKTGSAGRTRPTGRPRPPGTPRPAGTPGLPGRTRPAGMPKPPGEPHTLSEAWTSRVDWTSWPLTALQWSLTTIQWPLTTLQWPLELQIHCVSYLDELFPMMSYRLIFKIVCLHQCIYQVTELRSSLTGDQRTCVNKQRQTNSPSVSPQ